MARIVIDAWVIEFTFIMANNNITIYFLKIYVDDMNLAIYRIPA